MHAMPASLYNTRIPILALRRFPEALRKLDQVLNITPDDVSILAMKAAIAQAEGDLPRAAALLTPPHPNADDFRRFGPTNLTGNPGAQPRTNHPAGKGRTSQD